MHGRGPPGPMPNANNHVVVVQSISLGAFSTPPGVSMEYLEANSAALSSSATAMMYVLRESIKFCSCTRIALSIT